ncbi:MAG TPA: hypothetical protein VKR43_16280 [Bryobacteraceae bacterium]|nr:hypothetical protein [Bryobacteraceae bacterium]
MRQVGTAVFESRDCENRGVLFQAVNESFIGVLARRSQHGRVAPFDFRHGEIGCFEYGPALPDRGREDAPGVESRSAMVGEAGNQHEIISNLLNFAF